MTKASIETVETMEQFKQVVRDTYAAVRAESVRGSKEQRREVMARLRQDVSPSMFDGIDGESLLMLSMLALTRLQDGVNNVSEPQALADSFRGVFLQQYEELL